MSFQIHALPPEPYADLFDLSDEALAARNMRRVVADAKPGYPCRVSLADAEVGDTLILMNHAHLEGETPYAAAHAIYVREGAAQADPAPGDVPEVIASRILSVRAFGSDKLMRSADVLDGAALAPALDALFQDPGIAFVDIHNAKQGCFAARATRAG